jgi:asparagine synthase (glutamine-hydrolysing)
VEGLDLMCGIAGEVRFDDRPVSATDLERMGGTLLHRGPDADGLYVAPHGRAGLAFRRLRIIDLTASGNQPMPNEDGSIQLVFNGEIYNFQQLRARLESRGHTFRSRTDSEAIVHLYEDEGLEAIQQLDGMFALAIWDDRQRRLVLARDRTGKKPLFYAVTPRRVVFASEIKALLAHPEVSGDIEARSIPYFFMYGYVDAPRTMYRGIEQIPPATLMAFGRDGQATTRQYWNVATSAMRGRSERVARHDAAARVRSLLTDAVSKRLVSDVPLGAFLSGGVDSTIVVGLMSGLMREPVRTFSIGFEGDSAYDETSYARLAAQRFRTDHTEFVVRPSAVELIDRLIWHHDGPFGDASAIPTYIVSELTRRKVTVVLNGDGGDELFAGYLRFRAGVLSERIPRPAAAVLKMLVESLPSPSSERHRLAYARRFVRALNLPLYERVTRWNSLFYEQLDELLTPELCVPPVIPTRYLEREFAHLEQIPTVLGKLLHVNFTTYLPGDLSVKMDRCTMANSLEARSPFLDTALIEYVAALPDDLKLDGRRTKVILREACADLLPPAIQSRGKMGFGVPLGTWFRGALREYLCDHLLDPAARYRTYLTPSTVHRIVQKHLASEVDAGQQLWAILSFERWLRLLPEWRTSPRSDTAPAGLDLLERDRPLPQNA